MNELYSMAAELRDAEAELDNLILSFERVGLIRHPVTLAVTHSYPASMDGGDASRMGSVKLTLTDEEVRHLMASRFLAARAKVETLRSALAKAEKQWLKPSPSEAGETNEQQ